MKNLKIVLSIISAVLVISITLLVVYNIYTICAFKRYSPYTQKNTEWVSQDGKIKFIVPEEGSGEGTLMNDTGEIIDIIVVFYIGESTIEIWDASIRKNEVADDLLLGKGYGTGYSENNFVLKIKESTFFENNQMIKFIRVTK